jgi:aldehyde:ferredoxin oxidoreductase
VRGVRPEAVLTRAPAATTSGIDTISAGGTIAWAMECAERGLLDAPWLRFGDGAALLRALDEIGSGQGVGPLLALGSRRPRRSSGRAPSASPPTSRASSCRATSRGRCSRWRSAWP